VELKKEAIPVETGANNTVSNNSEIPVKYLQISSHLATSVTAGKKVNACLHTRETLQ
jgi:uncharacterized protein (DUF849 family)